MSKTQRILLKTVGGLAAVAAAGVGIYYLIQSIIAMHS